MLGRDRAAVARPRASKTSVLTACSCSRRKRCGVGALGRLHVVVQVAVAQVAEVDQPHARKARRQRSVGGGARRRECADTGSEMSCLMFSPSSACASGIDSRRCHIALRLRQALGHRGVADRAGFERGARAAASKRVARVGLALAVATVPAARSTARAAAAAAAAGSVAPPGPARSAFITSKPVSPAPSRCCASASSATQASSVAQAASAVSRGRRPRVQLQRRRGDDRPACLRCR